MTEAHIFPGMAHLSLISIKKVCKGGCKVVYNIDKVRVYYKEKLVLSGERDEQTGLWCVPIAETTAENKTYEALGLHLSPTQAAAPTTHATAASVYTLSNN